MSKVFNSWWEAYQYQLSSRTDLSDPLFMNDFDSFSEIEQLDIVATTHNREVVWLAVLESDNETYTQYGVSKYERWCKIKFEGFGTELKEVDGSFETFAHINQLVNADNKASIVYKHIEKIFEVYNFLTTGRISPQDSVRSGYDSNAKRMIEYAKTEFPRYEHLFETKAEEVKAETEVIKFEFGVPKSDSTWNNKCDLGETEPYEAEDFEEDLEDLEEESNVEVTYCDDCDEPEDDCQCEYCDDCNGNISYNGCTCDNKTPDGEPYELNEDEDDDFFEDVNFEGFQDSEPEPKPEHATSPIYDSSEDYDDLEEKSSYKICYGNRWEFEGEETLDDVTEEEAYEKYTELIKLGYEAVDLIQVRAVHRRF